MKKITEDKRQLFALISALAVIIFAVGIGVYAYNSSKNADEIFKNAEQSDEQASQNVYNPKIIDKIEGYTTLAAESRASVIALVQNSCNSTDGLKATITKATEGQVDMIISCPNGKQTRVIFVKKDSGWQKVYSGSVEIKCTDSAAAGLNGIISSCVDTNGQTVPVTQ